MPKEKIPLKIKIRAIWNHSLFKLFLSTCLLFSIGCLSMCYLGQKFNLDASESAGFFQGIVTAISIITGFLLIRYQTKQKEQYETENLKQSVRDFTLYVKHLLPDPLIEIQEQEKIINNNGQQITINIRFALRLVILEKIFSGNNKKILEEQYSIARRSLIQLQLSEDLEKLSTAYLGIQTAFLISDEISNLAKNTPLHTLQNITATKQQQLDSKINALSTIIKSLNKLLSLIHFIK